MLGLEHRTVWCCHSSIPTSSSKEPTQTALHQHYNYFNILNIVHHTVVMPFQNLIINLEKLKMNFTISVLHSRCKNQQLKNGAVWQLFVV